jgi:hypothetical protein
MRSAFVLLLLREGYPDVAAGVGTTLRVGALRTGEESAVLRTARGRGATFSVVTLFRVVLLTVVLRTTFSSMKKDIALLYHSLCFFSHKKCLFMHSMLDVRTYSMSIL